MSGKKPAVNGEKGESDLKEYGRTIKMTSDLESR